MSDSNTGLDTIQTLPDYLQEPCDEADGGIRAVDAQPPVVLPVVDLLNEVFFPGFESPIHVTREHTRRLLRDLGAQDRPYVIILTKKNNSESLPTEEELYHVGTLAEVLRTHIESDDASSFLVVRGLVRVRIEEFVGSDPYHTVRYSPLQTGMDEFEEEHVKLLTGRIRRIWRRYVEQLKKADLLGVVDKLGGRGIPDDPDKLVGWVMLRLPQQIVPIEDRQSVLETGLLLERLKLTEFYLNSVVEVQKVHIEVNQRTRDALEKQQREFILQQQMRIIQNELGEDPESNDVTKFTELGKQLKCSDAVRQAYEREVARLSRLNSMSPDYAVQVSYLQLFSELPWDICSRDNHDLVRAQRVLNKDHLGLDQVKERILEFLAVLKLRKDLKSPIICLYGPPGVGKTSLGKSVAQALGRKYVRMSLGGVNDEAEIRGHRRTYVGAMPGRIIQSLRKVKTSNPVMILDEIDKLGIGRAGDPASALLEVLDPEQNVAFYDNYLEVEYDLSRVLFIATANDVSSIPAALRDRMEMIEITGYLLEEKVGIATDHLIPNLLKEHGLKKTQFHLPSSLIELVIGSYTRESGVRKLNQMLAKLMRHQARHIALRDAYNKELTVEDIRERLGIARFTQEDVEASSAPGVAVGMAWTQTGGEILYVETSIAAGKGTLSTTGNLGEVMRESATIALQYVRAQAPSLGISQERFDSSHVHVHVPQGAIPKDGPSAGVTMVTSIVSAFLEQEPQSGVAMTGEITLRGKVLPVGGIKEKILAAKRANIRTIVLPEENRKDLEDIQPEYMEGLEFVHVRTIGEVVSRMFGR